MTVEKRTRVDRVRGFAGETGKTETVVLLLFLRNYIPNPLWNVGLPSRNLLVLSLSPSSVPLRRSLLLFLSLSRAGDFLSPGAEQSPCLATIITRTSMFLMFPTILMGKEGKWHVISTTQPQNKSADLFSAQKSRLTLTSVLQ